MLPRRYIIIISLLLAIALLAASCGQAPTTTERPQHKFVGSINSNKYHYPSCQWAQRIYAENEIWFSSSEDARNHGYVPCKVCSPP